MIDLGYVDETRLSRTAAELADVSLEIGHATGTPLKYAGRHAYSSVQGLELFGVAAYLGTQVGTVFGQKVPADVVLEFLRWTIVGTVFDASVGIAVALAVPNAVGVVIHDLGDLK